MLCVVFSAVLCLLSRASGALGATPSAEITALERLYASTNGDSWISDDGWLDGDPCDDDWYGVTCESGHVIKM